MARKTKYLDDKELYDTLTTNGANIWKLNSGKIAEGKDADLVIAKPRQGLSREDAFYNTDPKDILMVIHNGNVSLFDEEVYPQLKGINPDEYSKVYIDGACKFVQGNLPQLMQKIKLFYPGANFPVA
jgi:hypothetical protein